MVRLKALVAVFIMACTFACTGVAQQTANIPVTEFNKGIRQTDIQLLDVRTDGEYKSGHLQNALLADWNNETQFAYRTKALNKGKPVYTYCLSGGRSGAAADYLRKQGYTVYNLEGGITAWKKAGMPVENPLIVKQMTLLEFKEMIPADKTVLVDVGADWCPPCKKMNPIIDSLTKATNLNFLLVKVNGGDQIDLSKELNIEMLPTFILYKKGVETWRKTGLVEASDLAALLK